MAWTWPVGVQVGLFEVSVLSKRSLIKTVAIVWKIAFDIQEPDKIQEINQWQEPEIYLQIYRRLVFPYVTVANTGL